MEKIISLFHRNYETDRKVRNEIVPGAEWVVKGEGVATVKHDGTSCMVRDGRLFRRYDAKPGRTPPAGFEQSGTPDPVTGLVQGWVPVGYGNEDRWHREAFENQPGLANGTYELCGPKVQGNPYGYPPGSKHDLVLHGSEIIPDDGSEYAVPRDFEGLKRYFTERPIEGIVWHHPDGRMVKIKAKDFGIKWP